MEKVATADEKNDIAESYRKRKSTLEEEKNNTKAITESEIVLHVVLKHNKVTCDFTKKD